MNGIQKVSGSIPLCSTQRAGSFASPLCVEHARLRRAWLSEPLVAAATSPFQGECQNLLRRTWVASRLASLDSYATAADAAFGLRSCVAGN